MKTNKRILTLILSTISLYIPGLAQAQTTEQGNISGTWSPSGNPYIVIANCTVPSGQTLTIQPGVVVDIESNLSITVNGNIQAVGTPAQRIMFQGFPDTNIWYDISPNNTSGTNRFKYCDFLNADAAIGMGVNGDKQVMFVEIMNCTFSNCVYEAIYGEALGPALCGNGCSGNYISSATLNTTIKNCDFFNTGNGCVMKIYGSYANCNCSEFGGPYGYGYGYCNSTITGNIFQNLKGTAFKMETNSYAGGGNAVFINNTVVNSASGLTAQDPWSVTVQNNIFVGVTNVVTASDSVSWTIGYNTFYGNTTNFTGVPAAYGQVDWNNRNGTPSDIFYNIYQNPSFLATNDFHLQTNSPCINASAPGAAYNNLCSPPSSGSIYGDMGAYGGPDACNWLDTVPILSAQLSMTKSNGAIWLNWEPIPRSTYRIEYNTNNFNAMAGTNRWLTNSVLTPISAPISVAVSPNPLTNKAAFFRVKSLGRTPGN
jgi:hypothetical protein